LRWFNLAQNWFFEEILNINFPRPDSACNSCYAQNGDWSTSRGSGDHLQLKWFNLLLDPFVEEIKDLRREI
jgi:hypothetical protein